MSLRDFTGLTLRDLRDRDLACEYLAQLLLRRELTLLLGAGVSMGAGLPNWEKLVESCESEVGLVGKKDRSASELMKAIDKVRRNVGDSGGDRAMQDVVRRNLYKDVAVDGKYPIDIMQNKMLIAIGALVMASARGSVGDVFTLNFDDLLEWYLRLHGFRTQVVHEFPAYLRGNVDVTLFHPHGFLPLIEDVYPRSSWLLLSYSELVGRLAAGADSPWPTLLGSRFMSKRILTVGTSMNDLDIDVHLMRARSAQLDRGPLGFVVDVDISSDRQDELLEFGLVPISLDNHGEIPDFVLQVCRRASVAD